MADLRTPSALTRRSLLGGCTLAAFPIRAAPRLPLLAQTYIFVQEFARQRVALTDGVREMFQMLRGAGFTGVELMPGFLEPELSGQTLAVAREFGVAIPIVYTGGPMHLPEGTERTIANASRLAEFASDAINLNPDPIGRPKTEAELAMQAEGLNRLGKSLQQSGKRLFVHHHTPEMTDGAREWRHILKHTDPELVQLCVDTHWAYRSGQDWLSIVREAGPRLASLHVRNSTGGVWTESFGEGDLDYRALSQDLRRSKAAPYLVVELAYEQKTSRARTLADDLRRSREYAQHVFP